VCSSDLSAPVSLFAPKETVSSYSIPGKYNSLVSAILPVFLLVVVTLAPFCFPGMGTQASSFLVWMGAPSMVLLFSLMVATYTLGIRQGRTIKDVMTIYAGAVKDIALILLIIAGSGVFKQVMDESGVSVELASVLQHLPVHPLVLGWLMAALIRVCVGSATVAALTAAGIIIPLVEQMGVNPNLMVLSLGAGSLFFSHVNDAGFWMFKEYFGLSLKDTFRSWTVMETIVSVAGLIGVLIVNILI
jgi:Gnt-I system high-affinity gluconate transporter